MKFFLIIIIVSFFFFNCESRIDHNSRTDTIVLDTNSYVKSKKEVPISFLSSRDSNLVYLYNSLPMIKQNEMYYSLGKLNYEDGKFYVFLENEAKLGNPDSVETATIDTAILGVIFSHGYYTYQTYFFKATTNNQMFSVIRLIDQNVSYIEDNIVYLFKMDSNEKWKEITDISIDKSSIVNHFLLSPLPKIKLQDIFRSEYLPVSNSIVFKVNKVKRNILCNESKVDLICNVQESKINDSIILKWSSDYEKYIIAN